MVLKKRVLPQKRVKVLFEIGIILSVQRPSWNHLNRSVAVCPRFEEENSGEEVPPPELINEPTKAKDHLRTGSLRCSLAGEKSFNLRMNALSGSQRA